MEVLMTDNHLERTFVCYDARVQIHSIALDHTICLFLEGVIDYYVLHAAVLGNGVRDEAGDHTLGLGEDVLLELN